MTARTKVHPLTALIVTLVITAPLGVVPTAEAEGHTLTNDCIDSVPEPDGTPVEICYSLYQPAGADAGNPVPVIFHSHGWGGSRTNGEGEFTEWLDAGFGVLSFDQRSFGESGGTAHVQHPDYEGQDVQALVDLVADLPWVEQDDPGDPRIGAIGGSYGGGYQFNGAFTSIRDHQGDPRFDALAPEITWWDLKESLAPQDVPRTTWDTALYVAGATNHTETVHRGFAYGAATGEWPGTGEPGVAELDADLDAFFEKTGPKWHVSQGRQLDIPVLIGQGLNDNLFNLNQAVSNFQNALTSGARSDSIFVGYHGGHALPNVLPPANFVSGDPCSETITSGSDFDDLSLLFFRKHLKGESVEALGPYEGTYNLATEDGSCLSRLDSIDGTTAHPAGTIVTPTGVGGPIHVKLADGPVTVAGIPEVSADLTALGVDARAFYALSVGATPATALVVQANVLPVHLHNSLPGDTFPDHEIELPGVAVDVPAGQSLFLTVSGFSDMYFGHGSRTPGALLMENVQVHVPRL